MARTKKEAEVNAEVEEVKAAEAGTEEAKAEETKPAKKAGRPRKNAEAAEKAPAEKKAREVKAEEAGVNVIVEFRGMQRNIDEIVDKIKEEWVAAGHRASTIKSLNVYIKPEDYTAYYVINGKIEGKVWM